VANSALIVDDDPGFLGLTARILADLGVEPIWTATTATQALAAVQESRPDMMLVDVGLPDRLGIDLAYELSELPWQPRILLTSSDSEAMLAHHRRDGRPDLPFLAKEDLGTATLQRALLDG
jgi:CheY-like chemotaxis protein